ncbi:MAG: SMI1/KNR4 family protein [Bacillota bacterium]
MINKKIIKWDKNNSFYRVTEDAISEAEKTMGFPFPKELIDFYLQIGCGFFEGAKSNVNRLMGPFSVRDFRLRQNDFEFYPEIELYDHFEDNKLVFFESNLSALISIELGQKEKSKIYYYNTIIADSLEEFIQRIQEDDSYFVDLK